MKCKKCNHETLLTKANFCPNCGTPFEKARKQSSFGAVAALIALIILALYLTGIVKL
ncbi:MAG: hypothetical protein V1836_04455 [Candidatus Aenigmatarchaeota archaeon]